MIQIVNEVVCGNDTHINEVVCGDAFWLTGAICERARKALASLFTGHQLINWLHCLQVINSCLQVIIFLIW